LSIENYFRSIATLVGEVEKSFRANAPFAREIKVRLIVDAELLTIS